MRGFSDFSMDEYLAADSGIVVYLESTDDVFVFKKWFGNLLSKIQFEPISGEKANGGCGVIIKFFEDNPDLSFAYGVVDRDALLRNINSTRYPDCSSQWWNTDDDDFHSKHPFGDKIFILHRWELENYLLHPEALQKLLENRTRGETPLTTADEVAKKIIDNESDLVAVTLFSTLGEGSTGRMRYGQDKTGDDLWSMVDELGQSEEERDDHKSKITSFAENKNDPMERWDRLSRILDGKRTMYRLDNILHSDPREFCLEREYGALADHIANLGLIDPALNSWLYQVSN